MIFDSIYVPRSVVTRIEHDVRHNRHENLRNPCVCMRFEYKGYEVSVSSDSSHGAGHLFRTDIRVYKDDNDVTHEFCDSGSILTSTTDLINVFKTIDTWFDAEATRILRELVECKRLKEKIENLDASTYSIADAERATDMQTEYEARKAVAWGEALNLFK